MPSGPGNWLDLKERIMLCFIFCFIRAHILSRGTVRQRRIPRLVRTSKRSFWTCTRKLNALIILQDLQERLKCSFSTPLKQGEHWLLWFCKKQWWVTESQPFTVHGPVAFFTQLSWFYVPRGSGTDGTLSGNKIPGFAVPGCWWDTTWQGWSLISVSAQSLPSPPVDSGPLAFLAPHNQ